MPDCKHKRGERITGFDRDPLTSLIIEAKKKTFVSKEEAHRIFNMSNDNYNRYAYSLLKDANVLNKLTALGISKGIGGNEV